MVPLHTLYHGHMVALALSSPAGIRLLAVRILWPLHIVRVHRLRPAAVFLVAGSVQRFSKLLYIRIRQLSAGFREGLVDERLDILRAVSGSAV